MKTKTKNNDSSFKAYILFASMAIILFWIAIHPH